MGCAYCPIPPDEPKERVELCLAETRPAYCLAHQLTSKCFNKSLSSDLIIVGSFQSSIPIEKLSVLSHYLTIDSLAGVSFTSGSTGQPKAVALSHRNFLTHFNSLRHLSLLSMNDIILQELFTLCRECHIDEQRMKLFQGKLINLTEKRTILHTALRTPKDANEIILWDYTCK